MLKDAVRKYGPNAWRKVADAFENDRSELQCQLRWQKVLNPSVIKGPWTKEVRVVPSAWSLFGCVVACFAQECVQVHTAGFACACAGGRQGYRACAHPWSQEVVSYC